MSYLVYILKCADDTLYIGSTNDIEKRLLAHNGGKNGARYTRGRGPVKLVYSKKLKTKSAALKREWALKKLTRADKLKLIRNRRSTRRGTTRNPSRRPAELQ